jgi:peptidoglycan/xylan/chitin deacetylase (PgdA/CDA1 family)
LPPVRFILSFDDGPSGAQVENPTEAILNALASNPTQAGIKALFFVQTRISDAGASELGQALLAREDAEGHVLALHSGTSLGHLNHRELNDEVLEQSMRDGAADLLAVTRRPATLVRPPYWAYDDRTLAVYARNGLDMLLTDISANDGKTNGFKSSPRRFIHMASEMRKVREKIRNDEIPVVDGVIPVVLTFHDTNSYTAEHIFEYLQMIVDESREQGITLAAEPFYNNSRQLERAARVRAQDVEGRKEMTPWWWRWVLW